MTRQLYAKTANGAWWSLTGKVSLNVLRAMFTIILARLLSPYDFGVLAIVMLVMLFVRGLFWRSMVAAIIHARELSSVLLNTIFWASVLCSAVLSLAMYATSFMMTHHADIALAIRFMSPLILCFGLNTVPYALLQRDMNMHRQAQALVLGMTIGGVLAIISVPLFGDVRSLLVQQAVFIVISSIGFWWFSGWKPQLMFDYKALKASLPIIGAESSNHVLQYTSIRLDHAAIAIWLGPTALGYYDIAIRVHQSLFSVLHMTIDDVTFPLFSSLRSSTEKIHDALRHTLPLVHLVGIAIGMLFVLFATDIVRICFGENWLPAAVAIRIFGIIGVAQELDYYWNRVFVGGGQFRISVVVQLLKTLCITLAVLMTVYHGINAVAAGIAAISVALALLHPLIAHRTFHFPYRGYLVSSVPFLMGGVLMAMPTIVGLKASFFVQLVLAYVIYIVVAYMLSPKTITMAIRLAISRGKTNQ